MRPKTGKINPRVKTGTYRYVATFYHPLLKKRVTRGLETTDAYEARVVCDDLAYLCEYPDAALEQIQRRNAGNQSTAKLTSGVAATSNAKMEVLRNSVALGIFARGVKGSKTYTRVAKTAPLSAVSKAQQLAFSDAMGNDYALIPESVRPAALALNLKLSDADRAAFQHILKTFAAQVRDTMETSEKTVLMARAEAKHLELNDGKINPQDI